MYRQGQGRNSVAATRTRRVRVLLDTAPEPKEGWFAPSDAGHENLARYGSLDVVIAFIKRGLRR